MLILQGTLRAATTLGGGTNKKPAKSSRFAMFSRSRLTVAAWWR